MSVELINSSINSIGISGLQIFYDFNSYSVGGTVINSVQSGNSAYSGQIVGDAARFTGKGSYMFVAPLSRVTRISLGVTDGRRPQKICSFRSIWCRWWWCANWLGAGGAGNRKQAPVWYSRPSGDWGAGWNPTWDTAISGQPWLSVSASQITGP